MNNERAVQTLGMIVLFPDAHDQSDWIMIPDSLEIVPAKQLATQPICGSKMCFAGMTAALFAPPEAFFHSDRNENFFVPDDEGNYLVIENDLIYDPWHLDVYESYQHYREESISEFAQASLEISEAQSDWLFWGKRSVSELLSGIRHLMAHPNATEVELYEKCSDYQRGSA